MQAFYRNALAYAASLLLASLLLGYACLEASRQQTPLLPATASNLPWRATADSDAHQGGLSAMRVDASGGALRLRMLVAKAVSHPFASANLVFHDGGGQPVHLDLSRYRKLSLRVRCDPANTLGLAIPTFDPDVSQRHQLLTYRSPTGFFSCSGQWADVQLDLTRLETPQWWFDMFKQDLARNSYTLDQVPELSISTTFQSPTGIESTVEIEELTLEARDGRYMIFLGAALVLAWAGYGWWALRRYAKVLAEELRDRLRQDLPLVAYQQLSVQPHRDREKAAVLRLIATRYASPDLDLDTLAAEAGVNRNKVNEILKAELGFTFSGYLNKLRLTEAARLLSENGAATVAEIAYLVGYSNVSYFNKLFKEEYGRTPKSFRGALEETA
ncbi:AraC family transcriptional regulator [Massilia sp. ST3]|uniref:helix-turn-helix domain-containing protein n=1 Tax=Massilia sp. ST3 TaxID=2824903 RepID=UPI001B834C68|nr:AraC family transcriptional regulator [Massilia sp. ST3]MBQ5945959.1 helix-turn-helix transcriptional regulator [Massilia sp. ST3]